MKRLLKMSLTVVCTLGTALCFVSCKPKELQMDTEYVYVGISFKKADDLTIEDLSTFVSSPITGSIKTVKEFEKFLHDNMDRYSIERWVENGWEKIYLKTDISSVKATETSLIITKNDKQVSYDYTRDGDMFLTDLYDDFYFSEGEFHYDLRFNEKFAVVYNYEVK